MLHELETAAVVNKRVSGNSCLLMVCLREAAVDNHQLAVGLYRILTTHHMHGHMAVYYVAHTPGHAVCVKYVVAHLLVVTQLKVVAFLLLVRFLVLKEITLEGSHLGLVEEYGVAAAPEIQEVIYRKVLVIRFRVVLECAAYHTVNAVHQFASAELQSLVQLYFLKAAVRIQRH